tara:strand:+ start:3804 stop:5036 length:1233 start_codon:yes stop_codon:yes gene_type:complete
MQNTNKIFSDIIIAGNGLTSQILSLALINTLGENITINAIDRKEGERDFPNYVRSISLSLSSVNILKAIGIWDKISPKCFPVERIRVTHQSNNQTDKGYLEFDSRIDDQIISYILDEFDLRKLLSQELKKKKNYNLIYDTINSIKYIDNYAILRTDNNTFNAKLLIAADGKHSIIKKLSQIDSIKWDYKQTALSCLVKHTKENTGTALEKFLYTGPFAILPIGQNTSSIIWSANTEFMKQIKNLDSKRLIEKIAKEFDMERGLIKEVMSIGYFDLEFSIAKQLFSHRLALVGDAAHIVHPLAGQGMNIGLRDVAQLAEIIVDSLKYGLDFGQKNVLEQYEKYRMFDIISSALLFDGINRLYTNNSKSLDLLKTFAIVFVDKFPGLKKNFVREASGVSKKSPKLTKGISLN